MPEVRLETERLLLRPWRVHEAPVQRELWAERDPRVPPHRRLDADGHPSVAEIQEWIRASEPTTVGLLAVERRQDADVVGYCGLIDTGSAEHGQAELAYELLQRVWGHGYATEAAGAVVAWARSNGLARLTASVWDWNAASLRVLEKLGFTELGREESTYGTNLLTGMDL